MNATICPAASQPSSSWWTRLKRYFSISNGELTYSELQGLDAHMLKDAGVPAEVIAGLVREQLLQGQHRPPIVW